MNILYFADTRFPIERANGLQTMATCHALAARGHQVTLIARPDTEPEARDPFMFYGFPPLPDLTIETIPVFRGRHARRLRFLLAAMRRTGNQPDAVVYTRDLGLASLLLQLPITRRPTVVYESHGVATVVKEELPRLLGKGELAASDRQLQRLDAQDRRVWQRAAAYIAITRVLADELASLYGPRPNVFVVRDGAQLLEIDQRYPVPSPTLPLAAYAGHLYPWKGVDVFVRALALVPNLYGLIVGGHPKEPDLERVRSLARQLGILDRVEITGLVPPRDVRPQLHRATILVLPNTASAISERYTSPLKLFEYLTVGRPIVASDLPAIREVLTDERTALLVPPDDPAALAEAMARLLSNERLAGDLGRAAQALAPTYTWEQRARRIERALIAAQSS